MASIGSQLRMNDGMTPVLRRIKQSMDSVIRSFESMQSLSRTAISPTSAEAANAKYQEISDTIKGISDQLNTAIESQQRYNAQIQNGVNASGSLWNKVKGIAASIGAGKGVSMLAGLSDDMAGSQARLSLIVDDGGSVDALQQKIYNSAQSARGNYLETMNTVSKLGLLAGDSFRGNDEMIKFSELMNKNFILAGASVQEQSSAMYQLTQAMASGRLQGDEYRSIIENAPLLANSIEQYMQNAGVEGTMKEWASDGMLTADVIKNALFSSADEIEQRFSQMPMTWGQVWTSIKNRAIRALEPVLKKINELANNPQVQQGINSMINGFIMLVQAAMGVFEWVMLIATFIQSNWTFIEPIIWGIVFALIAYKIACLAATAALFIQSVATGISAAATGGATAAQWGFNTALYACPLFWIILLLGLLILIIYAVVAAINELTDSTTSATGIICGSVMFLVATISNVFGTLWNVAVDVFVLIYNLIADVFNFLGNVIDDPIGAIVHGFVNLADFVLGIVEMLAGALDTLFGSNLADAVHGWRNDMQGWADETFGEQKVFVERMNADDLKYKHWDPFESYDSGYNFGKGLDEKVTNLFGGIDGGKAGEESLGAYAFTPTPYSPLDDIADNTESIAATSGTSDENLRLLREIAEREAINRFTTAEVKVDMTGMSNNISSDMDIDGFLSVFTGKLEDALLTSAEGVHV